jgi:hypothetical protein
MCLNRKIRCIFRFLKLALLAPPGFESLQLMAHAGKAEVRAARQDIRRVIDLNMKITQSPACRKKENERDFWDMLIVKNDRR